MMVWTVGWGMGGDGGGNPGLSTGYTGAGCILDTLLNLLKFGAEGTSTLLLEVVSTLSLPGWDRFLV